MPSKIVLKVKNQQDNIPCVYRIQTQADRIQSQYITASSQF